MVVLYRLSVVVVIAASHLLALALGLYSFNQKYWIFKIQLWSKTPTHLSNKPNLPASANVESPLIALQYSQSKPHEKPNIFIFRTANNLECDTVYVGEKLIWHIDTKYLYNTVNTHMSHVKCWNLHIYHFEFECGAVLYTCLARL